MKFWLPTRRAFVFPVGHQQNIQWKYTEAVFLFMYVVHCFLLGITLQLLSNESTLMTGLCHKVSEPVMTQVCYMPSMIHIFKRFYLGRNYSRNPYLGGCSLVMCYKLCNPVISKPQHGMMTSLNGNIFRVTGHLCGEFTGPRGIPRTKASDAELWCFRWSASE